MTAEMRAIFEAAKKAAEAAKKGRKIDLRYDVCPKCGTYCQGDCRS